MLAYRTFAFKADSLSMTTPILPSNVGPFLKWPGGKRKVLPELRKYIPDTYNSYYEAFLGGGAMLFDIAPQNAVVSDVNAELINTYQTIQDDVDNLIKKLEQHAENNSQDYFYQIRALDRDEKAFAALSKVDKAARMIYLNKTCFNGLHRVSSKNYFNTSYGFYENPPIANKEMLKATSLWMKSRNIQFRHDDFSKVLNNIGSGNFVYLDPPYIPLTATASFTRYAKEGFEMDKQEELRDAAKKLDEEGNFVLLSNSDTPLTRDLYAGFVIKPIMVGRRISAKVSGRADVGEVIILGRTLSDAL
jgi:DNA adenine methylase